VTYIFCAIQILLLTYLLTSLLITYLDCLDGKRDYYQNCSVQDCVTQCSQLAAHLYEQLLQQIGFVTLGPIRDA